MYAELHCKTNYSFLTGASHADELVGQAVELGYAALAVTDENTLAGVVRAFAAARETSLKLIIGAEIIPNDGPPVVLWATDRQAYANLSRLITDGRRRAPKGECWLKMDDIARYSQGLLAGVMPWLPGQRSLLAHIDQDHASYEWFQVRGKRQTDNRRLATCREIFGDRCYLLAELYHGSDDAWRIEMLKKLSRETGLPLVAAGDVLYHSPARMPLHDVLTATRHHTTVQQAGDLLLPNAWRHLHPVAMRQQQFGEIEGALQRSIEIADRCEFRLDQLRYEYPVELTPNGQTPNEYLRQLTATGASRRYPDGVPARVQGQINHELDLIEDLGYEAYFLTVYDLVQFAKGKNILCHGRGSAANSAVCYCLEVTSVDPGTTDLLFERFISKERNEAPDIDIDFEHERREEVLQYLYEKYGRHRAGLAATVITYRARSAVRDVGKALGLSLDRVDALAKQVDGYYNPAGYDKSDLEKKCESAGIDPGSVIGQRLVYLVNDLLGFPRHLSQHVGGMVLTNGRLDELVPIENAAMDDRTVIQWDKDDLEELGLLKVDCLCLGMLTAIRKCFDLVSDYGRADLTLANIPAEDPRVYDMICAADTVGVFQIESRGQMSMLPRLRPRCWYDLVIEVAIVRPGPIQGNMVHPYLRRRNGEEPVVYPNDRIKAVLHRTLGIPIFQEQAMKLAVVGAGFSPGEADQLRRAMGAWRKTGVIEVFREKLMKGMEANGLDGEFAEQVFRQIRGFGEYGFPESHAASFAKLVYVSCWLKYYHPAAFTASLLNSQPMGFYSAPQLIADARQHGVRILPVDVNYSDWDNTLDTNAEFSRDETPTNVDEAGTSSSRSKHPHASPLPQPTVRMGLRQVSGLRMDAGEKIMAARDRGGPFTSLADFAHRTSLGQATIEQLSRADAMASLKQERRVALWQALGQEKKPQYQPLFGETDADDDQDALLPALEEQEEVFADYLATGFSLRAHPISFYRQQLQDLGVSTATDLETRPNDRHLRVAGLVILRQRPSTAKGITFVTLEDETGTMNLIIKPPVWERYYQLVRTLPAWIAHGKLERRSGVTHVIVSRLEDLAERLGEHRELKTRSRDFR